MSREHVQTGNPGGVANRPARRLFGCRAEDGPYNRPFAGALDVRRRRNAPARLACVLGGFAIVLEVIGLGAWQFETRWMGPWFPCLPLIVLSGSVLGLPVFILGVASAQRNWLNIAGETHWACVGIVLGACAMLGVVALFLQLLSGISGC